MSTTASPSIPPPPGGPPPHTTAAPTGARRSVLGIALAVIGIVLGVVAWGGPSGSTEEGDAALRPTEPVDRIELAVESGTIDVVPGDEVLVEATRRSGSAGSAFTMDSDLTDGRLQVTVSCPRLARLRGCRTPVRLVVPPGTPVTATTVAGSITATGLTGGADLRTEAGPIDVRDLEGAVRLRSETGSLRGTVRTGSVDAATSAGGIAITVMEDLTHLSAHTEAGSIDLVVPDAPYRVDAGTTLGRTDIEFADTPGASRDIVARTEVGALSIRTGPAGE